jgi:Reverse transcriptase (RNA-dependent DNA polymerase)
LIEINYIMSGRQGRGRGYGRNKNTSGRGSDTRSSNNNGQSTSYKPTKRTLADNIYYLGSAKQAADYETTTEFLINYIKKNFNFGNDIGTALEELEEFTIENYKPTLSYSVIQDAITREAEDRQYEIEFKAEYDAYMKRKQSLEVNMTKAYAFLWDQCAKAMQNKIEARTDYVTTVKSNPIELLKAIKQHALNYQEHRYEMSIILDALRALINLKQKENETLQEYTKRFKTSRDVLESHIGGPIELTKFMKNMKDYDKSDNEKVEKCRKQAFQQFLAFTYLDNSDKAKYGSLFTGLQTQQSLGNNQYPRTITEANNVLSSHRFDNPGKKTQEKPEKTKEGGTNNKKEEMPEMSFAMLEGKCYCCGKGGHKSPACRYKDRPKEEWAINKAKVKEQSHVNNEQKSTPPADIQNNANSNSSTSSKEGWSGAHVQFYQATEMRNWILLDNQSTVSLFCNPDLVTDINETTETLELSTNGGELYTNKKAAVPGYGTVWYDPDAITNIFSYAEMEDKYKITYDSSKEKAFIVHLPNKQVKFIRSGNGLYYYKPSIKKNAISNAQVKDIKIESVEENKAMYTDRQIKRAKTARQIYHALGTPSVNDFKAVLKMNAIKNLPITIEDIKLAEQIFGPDIGALKGKTTRQKPSPVVSDYIDIPPELIDNHQQVVLCMDGMKINGVSFLTTISRNIMYRTTEWIPNKTSQAYRSVLDNVFRIYNRAGFKIKTIICDNEFRPLMDELQDVYHVTMNYANPQEHVPEAERNNRVIKERFRAAFHRLPFSKLPTIMIKILAMECAKKLNFFPPKGGVSPYYSPRMIMHQQNLDYEKHCSIPFGSYVQAHHEPDPKNTNLPRTLDCIYLRYVDNEQGGNHLLDLRTGRTIKRRVVTPVPITQNVIELVHKMAEKDGMSSGLKIETKSGTILYDSSWIAGVDYEINRNRNEVDDNDDEENEDHEDDDESRYDEMDLNDIAEILQERSVNEAQQNNNQVEENDHDDQSDNNSENEQGNDDDDESNPVGEGDVETEIVATTMSGRAVRAPDRLTFHQSHLQTQGHETTEYSIETAKVIANNMISFNAMIIKNKFSFVETYSLKRGLKHFGQRGHEAAFGEMKQLHDRAVFAPVDVNTLTQQEKRRALESLIFLVEKRDGRVKARTCANGSTQRTYVSKEEAASPTVISESILLTATIDAEENRDVMTLDIPNAFVQTDMEVNGNERVMMKIRGPLVDMLVSLDAEMYQDYVVIENNMKVLYVQVLKALYGMLQASLLFYKKLRKDLEGIGFKINPYDPCVANRMINGKQHTLTWHVDDLKSSHVDSKVNDEFHKWLEKTYGDPKAQVKAVRGKLHDYLAMNLHFEEKGKLKVDMVDYIKSMVKEFPEELGKATCPWNENLFKVDPKSPKLSKEKKELFHTFVAKGLFASKRARPDIQPAIAFLSTRVKEPDENDWFKLTRMMNFLNSTCNDVLTLCSNGQRIITWHLDAAFAVHKDFKSHTGATMSLGSGAIQSVSTKQKINTRSSTEAELVSIDDVISKVLWTKLFLNEQGYNIKQNILLRDNQSSMKMEMNGKASSGKRTRHFNIKYFYITDLIERKEVTIQYCPTDLMIADYMTKPLTGAKFKKFRQLIMNYG